MDVVAVNYRSEDFVDVVKRETDGRGFSLAVISGVAGVVAMAALWILTGRFVAMPLIVIHIIADLTFFFLVWPGDATRVPVSESGVDFWLGTHVIQFVGFGMLAALGFRILANKLRGESSQ